MDLKELTALFRQLGARDPESWARSQIEEGVPQLGRFLFLRQAWNCVIEDGDTSWIDSATAAADADPSAPFSGIGLALRRLLDQGASTDALTDVVRGMQAQLLFELCYLLDDPGDLEDEVGDLGWMLMQVDETDETGESAVPLSGLHESVLDTDPTGREMRPSAPTD